MSFNLERATAITGDILADYYLPKMGINLLTRHFALKDLDRRIDSYCQNRGGVPDEERKRLHQQLSDEFKQNRWDVYRFPAIPGLGWRLPFFASLNIGTKWAGAWAPAGDTAFGIAYGALPEEGIMAGWGLAGVWAMAPHIPGLKNWGRVQTGAYAQAMDRTLGTAFDIKTKKPFYDNVRCNNDQGPPSDGNRVLEDEDATINESSLASVNQTAKTMMCSAEEAGGLVFQEESLADQIASMKGTLNSEETLSTSTPDLAAVNSGRSKSFPTISTLRMPVTMPKVSPIVRVAPVSGAARVVP